MKTLKLLNRQFLSIIAFTFFLGFNSYSEEQPVDIWNLDKKKTKETSSNITPIDNNENGNQATVSDIYKMQVQKETDKIKMEETLSLNKTKIVGLYDPEDYDLKIDMWANSDGDQLKNLFSNLTKLDLSNDAADLMNILLLTNAYYPNRNIVYFDRDNNSYSEDNFKMTQYISIDYSKYGYQFYIILDSTERVDISIDYNSNGYIGTTLY